jgi:O-antigen/teichoic acid export membrane protein
MAVRSSLALSALDSYLGLVLQVVSTAIIARILTPEQAGVFAVAAVFAALASTFRDFGVAEYLIQEKALDDESIRAALAVNIAVSWAMAASLFALAPAAGSFYREPGVADVMRVQSISFLLIPFGAVTMAWFRREMDFKPQLIAGLVANVTSFVVAVGLAVNGSGYMSLAWSSVAGVVVTVATSMAMRPKSFPRWPALRGVGRVIRFGKFASGIYIFGQAGKGAPEMIIGRTQDMAAVGMFSRAYGLVEVFNRLVLRSVMPVCLPYFAKAVREQGSPLPGLLTAISYLTVIGWTFLFFMAAAAYPAVRLLYGVQWLDAIPLARILCAVAAIELIYYPAKEAMLAQGRAKESNSLQMVIQGLRVTGLLAAIPFGLQGACWGLLAASALGAFAAHRFLAASIALRWTDSLEALWPSLRVATLAVAPFALWTLLMPIDEGNYLRCAVAGGILTTLLWAAAMRGFRHPLWPEVVRIAQACRSRLSRKSRGSDV